MSFSKVREMLSPQGCVAALERLSHAHQTVWFVRALGDAGLAGSMAQLNADFAVAEGRLGINNPDHYNTVFSLRHELFRILNDPDTSSDDDAWRQALDR